MRTVTRWMVLDGLGRAALRHWAGQGDPQARLITDTSIHAEPFGVYEEIRALGDLQPTRLGFVTTSHATIQSILRSDDFRTTSVSASVLPPLRWVERATRSGALHPLEPPSLLATDPPQHTRYRALVSSVFTARAVAALRPEIQAVADTLLDDLEREHGPVDLVDRYCARLPVAIISDILGVEERDRGRVLDFGERAAPSLDFALSLRRFREVERGLVAFDRWLAEHLEQLRAQPGDNLMSRLIEARVDGERLTDEEQRATAGLLLAAGFETTVNLLGSGARLLTQHPEALATLRDDPSRWPTAVDEVLRLESPVQLTARVADRDVEVSGRAVPRDSFITMILAAANRDPEVFTDPATFDVHRPNAGKHLSFSGGRHFCLGAALARLEGEIGLRTLFERFPDLRLAGPGVRRPTRVLRGWASLPVVLAP